MLLPTQTLLEFAIWHEEGSFNASDERSPKFLCLQICSGHCRHATLIFVGDSALSVKSSQIFCKQRDEGRLADA